MPRPEYEITTQHCSDLNYEKLLTLVKVNGAELIWLSVDQGLDNVELIIPHAPSEGFRADKVPLRIFEQALQAGLRAAAVATTQGSSP